MRNTAGVDAAWSRCAWCPLRHPRGPAEAIRLPVCNSPPCFQKAAACWWQLSACMHDTSARVLPGVHACICNACPALGTSRACPTARADPCAMAEWRSTRGRHSIQWGAEQVREVAGAWHAALPPAVLARVRSASWDGSAAIVSLQSPSQQPRTGDIEANALWLRPILHTNPNSVPSAFYIADCFVALDQLLHGALFQGKNIQRRALDEGSKLKTVLQALRRRWRDTTSSKSELVSTLGVPSAHVYKSSRALAPQLLSSTHAVRDYSRSPTGSGQALRSNVWGTSQGHERAHASLHRMHASETHAQANVAAGSRPDLMPHASRSAP